MDFACQKVDQCANLKISGTDHVNNVWMRSRQLRHFSANLCGEESEYPSRSHIGTYHLCDACNYID